MHAHICAGVSRDAILFDGRPAPSFEEQPVLCMPYCDNGNVICLEPALGGDVASRLKDMLCGWGLGLQDIAVPETCCESPGVYIGGNCSSHPKLGGGCHG